MAPPMRAPPPGPDPFTAERAALRARALTGLEVCPVNQHGCTYFSPSEWRFCPMCEWTSAILPAIAAGTLGAQGVAHDAIAEALAAGDAIKVGLDALHEALKGPLKAYDRSLAAFEIEGNAVPVAPAAAADGGGGAAGPIEGPIVGAGGAPKAPQRYVFTRGQLDNFVRFKGAPCDVLHDALWASLKASWPYAP